MPPRDIVVVGASAGGVEALMQLVARLPSTLPAALFIVQHVPAGGTSALPAILSRSGPLPAHHPVDREQIRAGAIYVAPPDRHLVVHDGYVRVVNGPRENRARPAVDPLFRTAARAYRERVAGVVLTGSLDDGAAGLAAIKRAGGVAIVQDPDEALVRSMPEHALAQVDVDHCLPIAGIAEQITRLATTAGTAEGARHMSASDAEQLAFESRIAELDLEAVEDDGRPGVPSQFGCPECGGVLWEMADAEVPRFRCRVGHAYAPASLLASQSEAVENALWSALRALEEKVSLTTRLLERATAGEYQSVAARFQRQLGDAEQQAAVIRDVLVTSQWSDIGFPHESVAESHMEAPEQVS